MTTCLVSHYDPYSPRWGRAPGDGTRGKKERRSGRRGGRELVIDKHR